MPAIARSSPYKRGYYQYEVQVRAVDANHTVVRVTAKITAWYADRVQTASGYRSLKSNGRLEVDLLDSLDDALAPTAAVKVPTVIPGRSTFKLSPNQSSSSGAELPDSPSAKASAGSFFNTPRLTRTAPSTTTASPAHSTAPPDSRTQELVQQLDSLQQILDNQTRPANLAVVKQSRTPVVSRPLDGASILFLADGEDEFEVLDRTEDWVHIQISGISRGWIKRSQVDLPGAATVSVATAGVDRENREAFRETKEEIGQFPGKWEPLDGKKVKIVWVQPSDKDQFDAAPKWNLAKAVFRRTDTEASKDGTEISGVVVVFDSQDGGMAAVTMATLQQWRAGHLPEDMLWKRSWRDPAELFKSTN